MKTLLMTGLLCVALSGCGQRGPLYFPESRTPAPPASAPAGGTVPDHTDEEAGQTPADTSGS